VVFSVITRGGVVNERKKMQSEEDKLNAEIRRHHIKATLSRDERNEWKEVRSHLRHHLSLILAGVLVALVFAIIGIVD
jgi:hypothetical protein